MSRANHGFRVYHPARQKAILRRLKGEHESPDEKRMADEAIVEIEELLRGRTRTRRLPSEARKPRLRSSSGYTLTLKKRRL